MNYTGVGHNFADQFGDSFSSTKTDLESKGLIEGEDFYINSQGVIIYISQKLPDHDNVSTVVMDPLTIKGGSGFPWLALLAAGVGIYAMTRG